MAKAHSFKITLSNNRTESEGLDFVLRSSSDLFHPDVIGRKNLLKLFGLGVSYLRAFDAIRISGVNPNGNILEIDSPKDITLIELKTTKKRLPDNPYGFFFGATENEFKLARTLGRYRRLMPVELERINTFPDNHTKLGDIADTKRAFFMGNALVTEVVTRLGLSLAKAIETT